MSGEATTLKLAVVGHTNAGKTSLLRTLLREVDFGDVSETPGTTQEVSGATITVDGRALIELYDTPGLEDSIGLLEMLESRRTDHRADGTALVEAFLNSPDGRARFDQEAKAIEQLLACDAALYVVDARDRVLEKNRDELRILGYCARPVIPVLNFVADPHARTHEWREQLARVNMHAVAAFDTVVLESHGEIHLYEKMMTLLDRFRPTIERVIALRTRERDALIRASTEALTEMLIDVAAFSMTVDVTDQKGVENAMDRLRDAIRRRESRCVKQLLALHRFREDDFTAGELPVVHGEWGEDLFSPEALQDYGIRTGGGAAAGAMVGLTVDVLLHGLSLGAGTAIGAAIGAALGAGQLPGKRLLDKLRGKTQLRADQSTWQLLAARQIDLIHALLHRGHAGRTPVQVRGEQSEALMKRIAQITKQLRVALGKPHWSRLEHTVGHGGGAPDAPDHTHSILPDTRRTRTAQTLASNLASVVCEMDG